MPRVAAAALVAALTVIAGCDTDGSPAPSTTTDPGTSLEVRDRNHVMLPLESVNDVMQAKLSHVHAVLEGICTQDYDQVEVNAAELERLSREAGWRVHTMVAYTVMSDQFSDIAATMTDHARARDAEALTQDYLDMTGTCLACHEFLRREGLYRDVPGAVSMTPDKPGGP